MQALNCCGDQEAHHNRNSSTAATQLPARPARAKLPKPRLLSQHQSTSVVPFDGTQAPSLMTTPRNQAALDPTVIEVEDSDSDDGNTNPRSSPTSTLGALKTKLIRRLSQKSQSKWRSQQSIGSSEEELARRAELRRLRQKRIQEELETEEEEETKGPPPIATQCRSPSPVLPELPGGGPRENVEFSVCEADDANSDHSSTPAQEMVALALPIITNTATSLRHRSSCPTGAIHSQDNSAPQVENILRDCGSLPEMPVSPQLEPVRSSNVRRSSSIDSWRLSYSAGQLAEYIREGELEAHSNGDVVQATLEQDSLEKAYSPLRGSTTSINNKQLSLSLRNYPREDELVQSRSSLANDAHDGKLLTPELDEDESQFEQSTGIFHNTTHIDQISPLDLWLRVSNTLQSISHSSTRRNSDSVIEDRPDASALGELGSNGRFKIGPCSSSSHRGYESALLRVPGSFATTGRSSGMPSPAFSIPKETEQRGAVSLDVNRGQMVQESLSSRYTTRPSSADLTRPVSSLGFVGPPRILQLSQTTAVNNLEPRGMVAADKSETSSYRTAPIQTLVPTTVISGKENARSSSSLETASETASFKHREAELKSVAKRFAEPRGRRHASSSVASRFREEFDDPLVRHSRKPSLLKWLLPKRGYHRNTLHKLGPFPHGHRNCVGAAVMSRRAVAPGPNQSTSLRKGQHFPTGDKDLKLEETATDLWQRAIRLEADRRDAQQRYQASPRHDHQHFTLEVPQSRDASSRLTTAIPAHARDTSSVYSRSNYDTQSGIQSPKSRSVVGQEDIQLMSTSQETSNRILKEWQHQIQSEVSSAHRAPSFTTHIHASGKSKVMPESWAKWPSHDRTKRNGATGANDCVTPKDYAVSRDTFEAGTNRTTTEKGHSPAGDDEHAPLERQSLTAKLGRSLRDGLAKLLPTRDGLLDEAVISRREGQRIRPGSTGYLEYPELELLPHHGGYQELEALEQTIDYIKRPSVSNETRPRGVSGASSRVPLSSRIAHEIQDLHCGDRPGSPDTGDFIKATTQPPNTPVSKRNASEAISATSQQFGTPMTHVSYEDCVPKHMLEENDSAKSDTKVMVQRSRSAAEHNVAGIPYKYSTWNGRAKSMSIKRMRACGSELERMIASEKGNLGQSSEERTAEIPEIKP
ncbi:hypothetical protein BKA67DRAFT_695885 [Truncatella angustata]|uniref:Uncharacterized protein n=1 Tax=Truncatella angustata TaxID=152316 RepID=A0A9P8RM76_9PEZI|nr:uncharacterized protein BKA67DRAFT_695885 [Truncatella angustata]KAH6645945.1 hypothetical protein BKA67DRAFT_695885 [Truncatella angustata]KAH8205326.1 hypothetical protein TruAng_000573 [Truncatella angustata]